MPPLCHLPFVGLLLPYLENGPSARTAGVAGRQWGFRPFEQGLGPLWEVGRERAPQGLRWADETSLHHTKPVQPDGGLLLSWHSCSPGIHAHPDSELALGSSPWGRSLRWWPSITPLRSAPPPGGCPWDSWVSGGVSWSQEPLQGRERGQSVACCGEDVAESGSFQGSQWLLGHPGQARLSPDWATHQQAPPAEGPSCPTQWGWHQQEGT